MAAVQRVRQGIRALLAFTRPVDFALAESVLSEEQMHLFQRMQRSEQLHSINVLKVLIENYSDVPDDLAVAALLHDVGKSRYPLWIWQKTLTVLIRRLLPRLYQHWSHNGSTDNPFARACVVAYQHPQWSTELAQQTEISDVALWLIEHHADSPQTWVDHPDHSLLIQLQEADNAN